MIDLGMVAAVESVVGATGRSPHTKKNPERKTTNGNVRNGKTESAKGDDAANDLSSSA
jgi:hypothetical protein